jgi:porin
MGGRLRINPAKTFYLQAGAFEADPALKPTDGFNWSTRTATGKVIAGEIGIQSASPKAAHAYHLRAGINYNDSPVSDPFLNTAGLSLVTSKRAQHSSMPDKPAGMSAEILSSHDCLGREAAM